MDTKTMWWNSHNHSKWAFICKYNCTIKGLELNVVLEEKLTSWASFFLTRSPSNWKLFPPECWWLQRRGIFLASLQNLGNCGLLGLHLPSSRAGYILHLQATNYKLQILSFSIINLLSVKFIFFINTLIRLIEAQLLLGSKGSCYAADWLRFFGITWVLFFTASTDFWFAK